jgi:hypothetical protein
MLVGPLGFAMGFPFVIVEHMLDLEHGRERQCPLAGLHPEHGSRCDAGS